MYQFSKSSKMPSNNMDYAIVTIKDTGLCVCVCLRDLQMLSLYIFFVVLSIHFIHHVFKGDFRNSE